MASESTRGLCGVGTFESGVIWELSVLSAQVCCESKTSLKNKVYQFKKSKQTTEEKFERKNAYLPGVKKIPSVHSLLCLCKGSLAIIALY